MSMGIQHCDYTKCHQVAYLKMVKMVKFVTCISP